MLLNGLHHISAITGDAAGNVDFYTERLGLRMIAKTVNQDDPTVYHLFYGDELARPGADLTFFEHPGAASGRAGAGMVHRIVWRVPSAASLAFWAERLSGAVLADGSLRFSDPEGLAHELVPSAASDPPLRAVHPEIPAEHALSGFEGVRAYSADPLHSATVIERLMGAEQRPDGAWELRGESRGGWIAWDQPPAERGRPGAGTVHHIAWATRDAEQAGWLDRLESARVPSSGLIDRHYFHSIYFREPGGVLYELATDEPGFTVDGPVEELGTRLILPPWLEPRRAQIEASLTPLPQPRAGRVRTSA